MKFFHNQFNEFRTFNKGIESCNFIDCLSNVIFRNSFVVVLLIMNRKFGERLF